MNELENYMNRNFVLHLDIISISSENKEPLNEFLFQLCLLKIFKSNEFIFVMSEAKHVYIEISNSFQNKLKNYCFFEKLISKKYHIDRFSIENFIVEEHELSEQELSQNPFKSKKSTQLCIQIVCNYFQQTQAADKTNSISSQFHVLDKDKCVDLIKKCFLEKLDKSCQESFSFIQLTSFFNLLGYYLYKFSVNEFLTPKILNYITRGLEGKLFF